MRPPSRGRAARRPRPATGIDTSATAAGNPAESFHYTLGGSVVSTYKPDGRGPERRETYILARDGHSLSAEGFTWRIQAASEISLAGKDFCRQVGTINGAGQITICLGFKDGATGTDSSNTAAGNPPESFRYTVEGNVVSTFKQDGRGPERRADYTVAADGQSLTVEGFTWRVQTSGVSLAGKQFCRQVGTINSAGRIEICLAFKDGTTGTDSSSSAAGKPPESFRYTVEGYKVTTFKPDGRGPERKAIYTLAADGQSLSAESFTWALKGGGISLAGQEFCRSVGRINGPGRMQACLSFKDGTTGTDSSSAAAGNPPESFRYTVEGNLVTTFKQDGRGPERRAVYTRSQTGKTLTAEGHRWTRTTN